MRWRAALVALAVLGLLAGCSGGSEPAPAPEPSATTTASPVPDATPTPTPTPTPSAVAATGTPAPEALSSFRCTKAKKDLWEAAGFLTNDGKKAATYQVTVYVGPIDGTSRQVRTQQVADVAADGSTRFQIDDIPADGDTCHVQVLATK